MVLVESNVVVAVVGQVVSVQEVTVTVTVMNVIVKSAVTVTELGGGVIVVIAGQPVMLIVFEVHEQGGQINREQGRVTGKAVIAVNFSLYALGRNVIV